MSYSVTSTGEVYKEPWIGWKLINPMYALLPYTPLAFLYYSARTRTRHTYYGFAGTPIRDQSNYSKLTAATYAVVDDLDAAIRKADELYARSGAPTKAALDTAGDAFRAQKFVPTPAAPAPAAQPPAAPPTFAMPEWVAPAALVGVGALILVTLVLTRRAPAKG